MLARLLAVIPHGLVAAVASALIVRGVRAYAHRLQWLDMPTARSSHVLPTPRGGGLGFVVPILAYLAFSPLGGLQPTAAWGAVVALGAVALVGWIDDRRGLAAGLRIFVHAAAGIMLAWIALRLGADPGFSAILTIPTAVAAIWWVFWSVSAINVINFMDGIDGLIGLEAVVFCGFAAVALAASPGDAMDPAPYAWTGLAVVAAGAVMGFLVYNWPPASIFMGDVGSGALGGLFVLLGIGSIYVREWTVVHAFLPLAPLVIDEVLTMLRRLSRGERPWVAHRSHVYQRLVQAGWSHRRVAFLYGLLSLPGAAIALALGGAQATFILSSVWYLVVTLTVLVLLGHGSDRRPARQRSGSAQ